MRPLLVRAPASQDEARKNASKAARPRQTRAHGLFVWFGQSSRRERERERDREKRGGEQRARARARARERQSESETESRRERERERYEAIRREGVGEPPSRRRCTCLVSTLVRRLAEVIDRARLHTSQIDVHQTWAGFARGARRLVLAGGRQLAEGAVDFRLASAAAPAPATTIHGTRERPAPAACGRRFPSIINRTAPCGM